jgi:hypothetical protein
VTPAIAHVTGQPVPSWLRATRLNLEYLRLALIDHHRDAFEEAPALSFDPTNWMARAIEADLTALIRTMELYEQDARLAEELEDVEF